jgi:hypothetical protein
METNPPIWIAVSIQSLKQHPFPMAIFPRPQQAHIVGSSTERNYSFRFETGPLNEEQTQKCRLLQRHGFTVVEFSDDEHWYYRERIRWEEATIRRALDKVAAIYRGHEDTNDMDAYDPELANAVLVIASKMFPKQLSMIDLKSELNPEPSSRALFAAIDALEADGFIEAKAMRSGPRNEIEDVAYIRATLEGRKYLSSSAESSTSAPGPVFHGDQIVNYGPVGAVGRGAHGVVNINEGWTGVSGEVDLQILAVQLEELRNECRKQASSREDDKQLALLAEAAEAAEKGDDKGVASFLSRVNKSVLGTAKDIGTDLAAKVIAEMLKGS